MRSPPLFVNIIALKGYHGKGQLPTAHHQECEAMLHHGHVLLWRSCCALARHFPPYLSCQISKRYVRWGFARALPPLITVYVILRNSPYFILRKYGHISTVPSSSSLACVSGRDCIVKSLTARRLGRSQHKLHHSKTFGSKVSYKYDTVSSISIQSYCHG